MQVEHYRYYRECIVAANEYVTRADNKELLQFIRKHGKVHAGLTGTTDYAYSGLLYKLFMFRPFSDILDTDMSVGVVDIRPTRNLALLTQIIGKFGICIELMYLMVHILIETQNYFLIFI